MPDRRDADDRVGRVLDRRIRDGVDADVVISMPGDCLHRRRVPRRARGAITPEARASADRGTSPLGRGVVMGRAYGLGLGRAALAQIDREDHHRPDRQELRLPVLQRAIPEVRGRRRRWPRRPREPGGRAGRCCSRPGRPATARTTRPARSSPSRSAASSSRSPSAGPRPGPISASRAGVVADSCCSSVSFPPVELLGLVEPSARADGAEMKSVNCRYSDCQFSMTSAKKAARSRTATGRSIAVVAQPWSW